MTKPDPLDLYFDGQADEEMKAYADRLREGLLQHSPAGGARSQVFRIVDADWLTDELVVTVVAEVRLFGPHVGSMPPRASTNRRARRRRGRGSA